MIYIINQQYLTILHIAKKKLRSGAFLSNRESFNLRCGVSLYCSEYASDRNNPFLRWFGTDYFFLNSVCSKKVSGMKWFRLKKIDRYV